MPALKLSATVQHGVQHQCYNAVLQCKPQLRADAVHVCCCACVLPCDREDPVVLGWQIAEDASDPGSPSSQTLLVSAS
jgi:hypothetical protein